MARTRVVSARLTEEEYQRLRELAGDGTLAEAVRGLLRPRPTVWLDMTYTHTAWLPDLAA